ncbi:DUF305 domain-containing protein [Mycolicibacillus trivialis]
MFATDAPWAPLPVLLTALAIGLSGCSGSSDTAPTSTADSSTTTTSSSVEQTAEHNAADIAFATDMIPHHEQALTLSDLVPERSDNPQLAALAADIKAAQQPEIDTLQQYLRDWGAPESTDTDHSDMAGMVDDATMAKLATLTGKDFDDLWLQSMIDHHRGAIDMAQTEIDEGVNPGATELATAIIDTQQAEIDQMTAMLGQ